MRTQINTHRDGSWLASFLFASSWISWSLSIYWWRTSFSSDLSILGEANNSWTKSLNLDYSLLNRLLNNHNLFQLRVLSLLRMKNKKRSLQSPQDLVSPSSRRNIKKLRPNQEKRPRQRTLHQGLRSHWGLLNHRSLLKRLPPSWKSQKRREKHE